MEQPKTWAPLGLSQGPRARKFFGVARWTPWSHRITRDCLVCGRSIVGKPNGQKFCDDECGSADRNGWDDGRVTAEGTDESLRVVGEAMGVTRERVRQLETSGMRKMLLLLNDLAAEGPDDETTGLSPAEQRELVYLKERERELAKDIAARSPEMAERLGIVKRKSKDQIRMAEYRKAKREGRVGE